MTWCDPVGLGVAVENSPGSESFLDAARSMHNVEA